MKTGLIYKVTNKLNGKCYVGQTVKTADTRWKEHKAAAKRGEGYLIGRALRKYPDEVFVWEIIVKDVPILFLDSFEKYWINHHNAFKIGYNCDAGGKGRSGFSPSEATKALWSKQRKGKEPWNKGKTTPDFVKKKQSEAAANRKSKVQNLDQLKELAKTRTGLKHQNAKPANIYNYETNELIAENVSISRWCKENKFSQGTMSNTARGLIKQYRGMYAKYIKDINE